MAGLDISKLALPQNQTGTKNSEEKDPLAFLKKDITLFSPINDKFKESFYLELSVLLSAGVDIKGSLELLEDQQSKAKLKDLIRNIRESIISGASVSEAVRQTEHFSAYEFYSLQIGEETGKLTQVLTELAAYYTKKLKQRRQMMQALSYPIIVLSTSVGAVGFMLRFIVPMFSDVFKRFGGELPYLTAQIIKLSKALESYGWTLLVLIALIVAFVRMNKQKEWFQRHSTRLILKLPIVGEIVRRVYLARLCSSFALLIGARVPLLQAIGLVRKMINFYPIATSLEQVEKDILQGELFHKSLSRFPVYDAKMIALLKVGEEVNQLDFFFDKLAVQNNEEVEHRSALLSSALEPMIIIFLGLIVGVILVAMYLPLFQLSTNIG
ncbi:type II secretion system F family protein [Cytophagaceae bacterium DM2B3-1]|uniref:General secretion pathway protein F n=1 Tax=Xanthocytophaga flava TaxID=3048013 RepID=A0ABT7CVR7_9BACT|nr:type II secretion system F family protein [Xanthocytophaga flavus]MDJ1497756.1 type II secretion system F family protein [Xanthocytophaga flavus]